MKKTLIILTIASTIAAMRWVIHQVKISTDTTNATNQNAVASTSSAAQDTAVSNVGTTNQGTAVASSSKGCAVR